jgi:hypothetical protein
VVTGVDAAAAVCRVAVTSWRVVYEPQLKGPCCDDMECSLMSPNFVDCDEKLDCRKVVCPPLPPPPPPVPRYSRMIAGVAEIYDYSDVGFDFGGGFEVEIGASVAVAVAVAVARSTRCAARSRRCACFVPSPCILPAVTLWLARCCCRHVPSPCPVWAGVQLHVPLHLHVQQRLRAVAARPRLVQVAVK